MLDATVTAQLKEHLTKLRQPVELAASLDGGPASDRTARLLDEIAALSDLVRVVRTDDDPRRPSFAVRRAGAPSDPGAGIRFAGAPSATSSARWSWPSCGWVGTRRPPPPT